MRLAIEIGIGRRFWYFFSLSQRKNCFGVACCSKHQVKFFIAHWQLVTRPKITHSLVYLFASIYRANAYDLFMCCVCAYVGIRC